LAESSAESSGEGTGGGSLDLDLGHFEGAKSDIGEDLGGSRTSEPDEGLVLVGELFTSKVHVFILEDLVEAVLEHSLERVTDECGADTFPDTHCSLLSDESLQGSPETFVFDRVDLLKEAR
jgi:hypothetical protein